MYIWLQGDIIGILDNNLQQIVQYTYDSWGNPISIKDANGNEITDTTHIGIINPYRYRGYRYDTETGLYYLQSRYYNPEWGRFLNADNYGGQIGGILTHNIYAYCLNNPINNYDPDGDIAFAIPFIVEGIKDFILAAVGFAGGIAIGGTIIDNIKDNESSKAKSEPVTTTRTKPKDMVIYRYGGANPGNLTPRIKDYKDGLSFSTIPPRANCKAVVTTIKAINSTGIVYAVHDRPGHVSVKPVGASVETWGKAGPNSIWTQAVKSVVIRWDGMK